MGKKIKIAGIATKAQGIKWFMLDNLRYAANNGFDVHVLCEQTDIFTYENMVGISFLPQKMSRGNVSPFEVVRSVWMLYKVFRKERYDIVQYTSSNAALYGSIASWFARVPVRIYCQWGISYTDYTGIKKWFYKVIGESDMFIFYSNSARYVLEILNLLFQKSYTVVRKEM